MHGWAEGQFERLPELAAELVRRQVGVIAATNTASALAATAATTSIPIVFAVPEDPVGLGLVANIARPGGNATGINFFSQEVVTKRLELLRELVPAANRVAVLVNPGAAATTETTVREVAGAARALGIQIQVFNANTSREINAAFASFVRERPDALFVGGDAFFQVRRAQVVNLASRHVVPATYGGREFAVAGGLMSYGSTLRTPIVRSVVMPAALSRAPSQPTCRWYRRLSSSWSSTPRPPGCSTSTFRRRCSPAPTR